MLWLEVDSTNNSPEGVAPSEPLEEGTTVVVDYQVGRGQRGNGWSSEKGKNLLFSSSLSQEIKVTTVHPVAHRLVGGKAVLIGSPMIFDQMANDIYWKEKK